MLRTMLCAALMMAATLPALAAETRPPQDTERTSFDAFYRAHFPGARPAAPVFTIERESAGAPWRIAAHVDARPRRGQRGLCRMERMRFVMGKEWAMEQPMRLAWIAPAACAAPPPQHILVMERMPDTDVLALMASHTSLLARARLLFSGNTSCAAQRSWRFRLHAIDVGSVVDGGEEMAELIFRSDRHSTATVWVRRAGTAYDPWNVSCN